jgi:hypothetical protein
VRYLKVAQDWGCDVCEQVRAVLKNAINIKAKCRMLKSRACTKDAADKSLMAITMQSTH